MAWGFVLIRLEDDQVLDLRLVQFAGIEVLIGTSQVPRPSGGLCATASRP